MRTANEVRGIVEARPVKASTEEYVSARIEDAVQSGYSSSKIWLKKDSVGEAIVLLVTHGFQFKELQQEPNSVQLEVWW